MKFGRNGYVKCKLSHLLYLSKIGSVDIMNQLYVAPNCKKTSNYVHINFFSIILTNISLDKWPSDVATKIRFIANVNIAGFNASVTKL